MTSTLQETAINFIAEGTRLEGKMRFGQISRVHGTLVGEVIAETGSTLILGESAVVEGSIEAETLVVEGYVQGDITASGKVLIAGNGRVIGNIRTSALVLEFGAYFEGKCSMEIAAAAAV